MEPKIRRGSQISCESLPPTRVFTTVGIYKGERVAIKKITKKKVVDVTKKLLWEIKQVRDVTSENTVRYSSLSIDMERFSPSLYLIS